LQHHIGASIPSLAFGLNTFYIRSMRVIRYNLYQSPDARPPVSTSSRAFGRGAVRGESRVYPAAEPRSGVPSVQGQRQSRGRPPRAVHARRGVIARKEHDSELPESLVVLDKGTSIEGTTKQIIYLGRIFTRFDNSNIDKNNVFGST
jgi:hypothetical protein